MTVSGIRSEFLLVCASLLVGMVLAAVVAYPRWIADSRMILEVTFSEAPQGEPPVFTLRYDRGWGTGSLRVVDPLDGRTEEPERFRWVFDARPIESITLGIGKWAGPLEIESAVLADQTGSAIHRFDASRIQLGDGGSYPLSEVAPGSYHWLILSSGEAGIIPRNQAFSPESARATGLGFLAGSFLAWIFLQLCRARPFRMAFWERFRVSYPQEGEGTRLPRAVVWGGLCLAGVWVVFRSWENFRSPSLFVEDAFHYFNHFYGAQVAFLDGIFRNPNGYLNLLPNFLAWSFAWIDVRWTPGAYVAFAVAFSLFAAVLPLATGWFRNPWIAFVLPVVLGLSGLNHVFYYTTLTFQMYVAILVLLVMLFLPEPRSWKSWLLRTGLGVLLVFSGPYSVVAVPAGLLLLLFFQPSRQSWFWAAMAVTGVVFLETTTGMTRLQNLWETDLLQNMASVMLERVLFFGWGIVGLVPGGLVVGVFLAVVYGLLWQDQSFRRIGTVFLAIVATAMAPLFLSSKFILYSNPYDCHVLISQFFWLLFLLFAADSFARKFSLRGGLAPVLAACFLVFTAVDQRMNPQKGYAEPNPAVLSFVEKVKAAENLGLEKDNEFVILKGTGAMQEAFQPRVRVGSTRADARERTAADLGIQ